MDLTAIADTNWHAEKVVFRMPQQLSANAPYAIRFAYTGTILDATNAVFLGAVGVAPMTQFYPGGPFFCGFAGSTNVNASGLYPDYWTFAVTYTPGKMQRAVFRYFNPATLTPQTPGLIVPAITSGSATIADSLVA